MRLTLPLLALLVAPLAFAQSAKDLAAGRRVLDLGSQSLAALSASLDERFAAALDVLAATAGRVIVCGMGKSGHVGRKIAATLASTGTPSQFVHPAEASHGDLGMITGQDSVLALSNSGETAELGDVLSYVKRFGIRLVAIVGREDSSLANAADVALVLPGTADTATATRVAADPNRAADPARWAPPTSPVTPTPTTTRETPCPAPAPATRRPGRRAGEARRRCGCGSASC